MGEFGQLRLHGRHFFLYLLFYLLLDHVRELLFHGITECIERGLCELGNCSGG